MDVWWDNIWWEGVVASVTKHSGRGINIWKRPEMTVSFPQSASEVTTKQKELVRPRMRWECLQWLPEEKPGSGAGAAAPTRRCLLCGGCGAVA